MVHLIRLTNFSPVVRDHERGNIIAKGCAYLTFSVSVQGLEPYSQKHTEMFLVSICDNVM
jgi:hypothetical protein